MRLNSRLSLQMLPDFLEMTMNDKIPSKVVMVIGALLLLASLFADVVGIGDDAGFGRQQTIGTVAGVVVLAIGIYLDRRSGQGGTTDSGGTDDT